MSSDATILPSTLHHRAIKPLGLLRVDGKSVLGLLLLSFFAAPFLESSPLGLVVEAVLLSFVLFAGVLAVGGNRQTLLTAIALAIPAFAGKRLNYASPESAPAEIYITFVILTVGFVAWQFLRFILRARRVDSAVMCTGIAAFLLVALLFAFVYQLIDRQFPASFTATAGPQVAREMKGMFALYFSLVTLCTVGFGDIVPTTDIARMAAMFEGATGVFFIAVLISRLVSLYTLEQQQQSPASVPESSHAAESPDP